MASSVAPTAANNGDRVRIFVLLPAALADSGFHHAISTGQPQQSRKAQMVHGRHHHLGSARVVQTKCASLGVIFFIGCIVGALAQQRVTGLPVRQSTLALIILIAGTSLAASYNVFG